MPRIRFALESDGAIKNPALEPEAGWRIRSLPEAGIRIKDTRPVATRKVRFVGPEAGRGWPTPVAGRGWPAPVAGRGWPAPRAARRVLRAA